MNERITNGAMSPDARRAAGAFFAYAKKHPYDPNKPLTGLQERMQGGEPGPALPAIPPHLLHKYKIS